MTKKITKITDLKPDDRNANRHTQRGRGMLQNAVQQYGSREAGTLDKNGKIIGGNLRQEIYGEIGLENIQVVKADPKIPVFLQYDDLDLDDHDNPARMIALGLNRIAQASIDFDPEVLAGLQEFEGVDLGALWFDNELAQIGVIEPDPIDYDELWQGMPEFENEEQASRSIVVHFVSDDDVERFCELLNLSITKKTKSVWYPLPPDLVTGIFED